MATSNKNLSAYDKSKIKSDADLIIGIVVSEWNDEITSNLCKGAVETLLENNVLEENIKIQKVPGAFELPLGAQFLLKNQNFDGIITIGTVIQGETKHFDFVCQGATEGIMRVMLDFNTPISFCVLTDNTIDQSIARSGGKHGNKGIEAAVSLLQMIAAHKSLS
ncbi:MAG: 6,7-dimethyl-8-ribityllumazine synthase [Crocinitomicaceae bacterium TMED16]|nr:MAG: 6,7-dimethyl-8-ribityllumazine synthase [Crocinitomicaceae bacterium TMED16]